MALILSGGTVSVVTGFYFLPLQHGHDGTTTVLVAMPFGALASFCLHYASVLLELFIGALTTRLLLCVPAVYGTWKAWALLLRRERSTFAICLLSYVGFLLMWWVAYGAMLDGTVHIPWDTYASLRSGLMGSS